MPSKSVTTTRWSAVAALVLSACGSDDPVTPGNEVRATIGWESLDATVRLYIPQAIQGGTIASSFKKAPTTAGIACTWNMELATGSVLPFQMFAAGTARG